MDEDFSGMLDSRKRLLGIIRKKPGIHFRELQRQADMAFGEVEYHLGVLEKTDVITKAIESYHTRYYPVDELTSDEKEIMGLLRQEKLREILLFILSEGEAGHGDIVNRFHLLKSTATFYMDKLISGGVVEREKRGRRVVYKVMEPRTILRLMLLYREGFGDRIVKLVEGLWGNFGLQIPKK